MNKWERGSCLKCLMMKLDEAISILTEILNFISTGYYECIFLLVTSSGITQLRGHQVNYPFLAPFWGQGWEKGWSFTQATVPMTFCLCCEHREKMNQTQLAVDLVFNPVVWTRGYWTLHSQKPITCQQSIHMKTCVTSSGWQTALYICPCAQEYASQFFALICCVIYRQNCKLLVVVFSRLASKTASVSDLSWEEEGALSQLLLLGQLAGTTVPKKLA